MTLLTFSLAPPSAARLHDALVCLAKFSEYVSIEARAQQLVLSALNSSKSAYVAFTLDEVSFFIEYHFAASSQQRDGGFSCQVLNKALLSIFRSKLVDSKGGGSTLEKCEVELQDSAEHAESRINVRMICAQGVIKTYRLTFEVTDSVHALFDQNRARNRWRIQSAWLKEYMEYFGVKAEQLDLCSENGRLTLTSYTEKVVHGKEVLKQPLETAVSIELVDFEESSVDELLHVAINVKDFRNMVLHAETMRASVTALYADAGRPLQFFYNGDGIRCEFTLMTIGDYRPGTTTTGNRSVARDAVRRSTSVTSNSLHRDAQNMPPPIRKAPVRAPSAPSRSASQLGSRTDGSAYQSVPNEDPDSLFIPEQDEDAQWAPADEEDEEVVGWNHSADYDHQPLGTFRDSRPDASTARAGAELGFDSQGIAPTQHASQVRGIFDF